VRSLYQQEDNSTRVIACNSGLVTEVCAVSRASARQQTLGDLSWIYLDGSQHVKSHGNVGFLQDFVVPSQRGNTTVDHCSQM
jgi:hypothetical protein